jgi:putative RNA 2'-phosphotransferase
VGDLVLKECASHGYFRDEYCPVCGDKAKFLLSDQELDVLGRTMAGVLRHFPQRYGLDMDERGWVDLRDFITAVQIRNRRFKFLKPHHILGIIETDRKGRYQFRDGRIRATYAHSIRVNLDHPTEDVPDQLYYPTSEEECQVLLDAGITPGDRAMVHLSGNYDAAMEAGKVRIRNPVILEIDTVGARDDGVTIMRAGKTVYLTDEVPPDYVRRLEEEELPAPAADEEE